MKLTMDNTSACGVERCPQFYAWRFEQNIVPVAVAAPLSFGGAFHKALQTYYDKNRDTIEACAEFSVAWEPFEGMDKKRTEAKGHELVLAWDEQFKDEPWIDKKGEIEFDLPLAKICPNCLVEYDPFITLVEYDPATGQEFCPVCHHELILIHYAGIIDRIGLFHGDWTIHEFKTSSNPRDFVVRPNNQVTGYVWGAQALLGQPFKNSLVTIAGVFKSSEKGYYLSKAGGDTKGTRVSIMTRHFTPRSEDELSDFRTRVIDDALNIVKYRKSGIWPKWTESCAYKYGLCPYQPLCQAPHNQQKFLLETAYRIEPWVPGKRPIGEEA